nr:uncharacterized abhydrolase domain-containing protein DDB_G0269086-like [Aegilops tauschii subsp. strangulata]
MMQSFTTQSAADALEQGHEYLPDRAVSNVDDPELGAAALEEDDATGGGSGAGGSGGGGYLDEWLDDDEEIEPRHPPAANKAGTSSSAAASAPGGASKRRAGKPLFGSRPKKAKSTAVATKEAEAAAKAARLQKARKQPPMVSVAPLSLERSDSASVIGTTGGSTNTRRVDPRAELLAAMEQNAQEARERAEKEEADAANAAQEEADAAAKAQADAAAKARAAAAAKAEAEEAARNQPPQLIIPLRSMPPRPEIQVPTRGAGDEQTVMERGGGDDIILGAEMPPQAPTAEAQSSRPDALLVPPVDDELVVRANPVVRTPARCHAEKVASTPRPQEARAASANATLRQQLGEAQTALCAKEAECSKVAEERDRLVKELADQADRHKAALQAAKDNETGLLAEFETKRSNWGEEKKALTDGYSNIEDMIDEFFPGYAAAAGRAIETRRDERRRKASKSRPSRPGPSTSSFLPSGRAFSRLTECFAACSALGPRCCPPSG